MKNLKDVMRVVKTVAPVVKDDQNEEILNLLRNICLKPFSYTLELSERMALDKAKRFLHDNELI